MQKTIFYNSILMIFVSLKFTIQYEWRKNLMTILVCIKKFLYIIQRTNKVLQWHFLTDITRRDNRSSLVLGYKLLAMFELYSLFPLKTCIILKLFAKIVIIFSSGCKYIIAFWRRYQRVGSDGIIAVSVFYWIFEFWG